VGNTAAETLWTPSPEQTEASRLRKFLDKIEVSNLSALQIRAQQDPEWFWSNVIDDIGIEWSQRPERMLDDSAGIAWTKWWVGGRLNLATLACDRWAARKPQSIALISESEDGTTVTLTYAELSAEVARVCGALHELGIERGDAVGLCLPMSVECVAVFLACAKIGAVVAPLFSGYGAGAIASRLNDCEAKVLVIADGFHRRGKPILAKQVGDDAAEQIGSLEHILVVSRLGTSDTPMRIGRDVWYHEVVSRQAFSASTTDTSAADNFMLIYTSGTTGKPKGTVHNHGGFPIKATQDMAHCFDVQPTDRLLWFTDIGWMMGPWAICGALTIGATLVLYDGVPDWPGPDRLWSVVERHGVTVLGVAPTVVRALMRHGDEHVQVHDLTSLRVLGSSGEPWNVDPWVWFQEVVGANRCPIINYSGGTEVSGGIVSGNLLTPSKPCSFGGPCPGMDADVVDESGESVRGTVGELVVRSPWPGMTNSFWKDDARYLDTYWSRFENVWVHGDWAQVDSDGLWYIRGRSDDTIKIAGKRVGPAEVESALVASGLCSEAAAVGIPDELKGESLVVFCVLLHDTPASEETKARLTQAVVDELGRSLKPSRVEIVAELPKTRNAKVLRRVVRAVYLGSDPGDLTALENPSALEAIRAVS
jgi:acetyl-CoA synthetase